MPRYAGSRGARPNGAPAYYLARPASLWINATRTRHRPPRAQTRARDRAQGAGGLPAAHQPVVISGREPGYPKEDRAGDR